MIDVKPLPHGRKVLVRLKCYVFSSALAGLIGIRDWDMRDLQKYVAGNPSVRMAVPAG
jgi:hypothetical protein